VLLVGTTALIVSVVAVVLFVVFLNSFASPKKEFALAPVQIEEPRPELGPELSPELSPELDAGVLPAPDAEPKPGPNTAPENPEPSTPSIKEAESQPNGAINSSDLGVLPKDTADPVIPPAIAPDLKLGMSAQKRVEPNEPAPAPVDEVNMIPPAGLAQFAPVFELGGTGFSSDAATLEPIEPGFTGGGGVVDLGLLTHPSPVVPEPWDNVKSTSILKLRIAQKPLSQVLLVLGQLANSGLGWDARLLHYSTIDPLQNVSLEAVNSTLEDELAKLATQVPFDKQIVAPNVALAKDADKPPVGIPAEIPDETVVTRIQLIPVAKIVADQLPSEWSLDGLVRAEESANGAIADETSLSQWNQILRTHFPPGDGLWAMDGMSIVWSPQASLADRASMAVFLDQVRQIYGSPTKSGFFQNSSDTAGKDLHSVMWMQPIQAYNVAYKQLRNKGVSVFAESTSSPALLDEAARECELELVMDWPSLQSHGFSHAASSLSLFRNRTWPQIAKRTMDQFDLVAVVDGPKRLVLTTLAQQRRWPRSTILPLRPGESIESVGESFRVLSPTDERGLSILSVTPLPKKDAADSVEYVIIRHCPPNTKQLERLEVRRALHMTVED
jgi:hypothetical protein